MVCIYTVTMVTIRSMEHDNHSKIIDALGGTTKVARLCGVESQAVSKWRREGIPQARLLFLQAMNPGLFGMRKRGMRLVESKKKEVA
jgi:hypothetical protein